LLEWKAVLHGYGSLLHYIVVGLLSISFTYDFEKGMDKEEGSGVCTTTKKYIAFCVQIIQLLTLTHENSF
jgi:hypothetical protein